MRAKVDMEPQAPAETATRPYLGSMPFNPSSSLAKLLDAPVRPGRVTWLGLRPERRAPIEVFQTVQLETGRGVLGDRYSRKDGNRQVTLIGRENLAAIGAFLGAGPVNPDLVRRNIVVEGLNLLALKERRFRIGEAILETSGECHPCSRMEEALGIGGYNAMRGQGGITARVLRGGEIRVGDAVERFDEPNFDLSTSGVGLPT
jgi:MOSC domain-containing protein YiiM